MNPELAEIRSKQWKIPIEHVKIIYHDAGENIPVLLREYNIAPKEKPLVGVFLKYLVNGAILKNDFKYTTPIIREWTNLHKLSIQDFTNLKKATLKIYNKLTAYKDTNERNFYAWNIHAVSMSEKDT